jgi:16S rRNA C967 or C1407 C5-methylase (RsmB/RsmF family)
VLESPRHLAQWSPARIKNLRAAQWALLSAAFRLLRGGGYLLYATCALHPDENDGIVNRLLEKFPRAKIMPRQEPPREAFEHFAGTLPAPEQTSTGWRVFPDTANGAGPMFFSLIQKNESA